MLVLVVAVAVAVLAKLIKEKTEEPLVVEAVVEQVVHQVVEDQVEQQVQVVKLVVQVLKPLVEEEDLVVTLVVDKQLVVQVDLVDRHREVLVEDKVEEVPMVLQLEEIQVLAYLLTIVVQYRVVLEQQECHKFTN